MADNGAEIEVEIRLMAVWVAILVGIAAASVILWRVLTRSRRSD